jgi:hydroxyacylglutathione hydrolase
MGLLCALVAQLDRVPGYEPGGQRFESSPVQCMLGFKVFPSGPIPTNAILFACLVTQKAAVIDPSMGSTASILEEAQKRQWSIESIFLTHSHWDHIADVHALKAETKAPVFVHPLDAPNLSHPGADRLPLQYKIIGEEADGFLEEGAIYRVGELQIEVIHTPGHSPGSVCLYLPNENTLFSGDTFFRGTMGTLHLPTAQEEKMWSSLKKLSKLPPSTRVIPGHGGETTIGREGWLQNPEERFKKR